MILHGNQRGGAKELALHLLKEENEHVEVYELRGFVSDNLLSALNEIYAISRGTKATKFMFSLSLNPPPEEKVSTKKFIDAINQVEKKLGLSEQPRAIVFHEKNARRHCHVVWSRINTKEMKAIPMPFTKLKLMDISRELYRENNWDMPKGMLNSKDRNPLNFNLAQWQQAKRLGKNPKTIKDNFKDCWITSDSQAAFSQALKERGYILAKGDRRGFVALDYRCEVFSIAKWTGVKAKDVREKLIDRDSLPSVDEAKVQISQDMTAHLDKLKKEQHLAINSRISEIEQSILQMKKKHAAERKSLFQKQQIRMNEEIKIRQERFNQGLRGFVDWLTGKHKNIKQQNEQEAWEAKQRDAKEKDVLIFKQQELRRNLQERINRLEKFYGRREQRLSNDISKYQEFTNSKEKFIKFERDLSRQHSRNFSRLEW